MPHYQGFRVVCTTCRYNSRPSKSPREGIRRVILRQFSTCNGCGAQFKEIALPNRPLVDEEIDQLFDEGKVETVEQLQHYFFDGNPKLWVMKRRKDGRATIKAVGAV